MPIQVCSRPHIDVSTRSGHEHSFKIDEFVSQDHLKGGGHLPYPFKYG